MRAHFSIGLALFIAACGGVEPFSSSDPATVPQASEDDAVSVEGVLFTGDEAAATLAFANRGTQSQIATEAGVGSRVATNIINARPIGTVASLGAVAYVGASTLTKLKQYAVVWNAPSPYSVGCAAGGRFDDVLFSGLEACRALDVANSAGFLQLISLDPGARRVIYDRRPWRSLRDLAAASGIGKSTMQAMRALAAEWVIGKSGTPDTVEAVLRLRPAGESSRAPQVTIDRARVVGRVAGTVCVWIGDAVTSGPMAPRLQLCADRLTANVDTLLRQSLTANKVVRARATFRVRSNGTPYLQGTASDFLVITAEPLP